MKNTYKQILFLYLNNRNFLMLLGIYLLTTVFSKLLYHSGFLYYAEEVFTMLFVVSLWAAFYLGMMIKRQFANQRASLLPYYRIAHITFLIGLYSVLICIAYFWEFGYKPVASISAHGLWGIYFTCLFIALLITYLGYLSIGRILIYAYVILLVFSGQAIDFIVMLDSSSYLAYAMAVACALLSGFFIHRLFRLKEDNFEYNHLFSWPPRNLIINQMRASQSISDFLNPLNRMFKMKTRNSSILKYHQERNIFARAYHWDYTEHIDVKVIWILMLIAAPLMLMLLNKHPALRSFGQNVYSNFLLLTLSPIFVAIGVNYRRIAYWGYDVLKPVNKRQYMLQQGIVVLTSLVLYWTLFAVCFAILPNVIVQPELFSDERFWAYLGLTLSFSFMSLCWLVFLSCKKDSSTVIIQGLTLSLIALFCFYFVPRFSFEQLIVGNLIFVAGSVVLGRKAYEAWCDNEFHSK